MLGIFFQSRYLCNFYLYIAGNINFASCPGLLFAVLVTAVLTDSIKDAVGRPRPDFFWRCFPNGKGVSPCQLVNFRSFFVNQ